MKRFFFSTVKTVSVFSALIAEQGRLFYDLNLLTGSTGSSITNDNIGLNDFVDGNTGTVISTPILIEHSGYRGMQSTSTNGVSLGTNGSDLINTSFELFFKIRFLGTDLLSSDQLFLVFKVVVSMRTCIMPGLKWSIKQMVKVIFTRTSIRFFRNLRRNGYMYVIDSTLRVMN